MHMKKVLVFLGLVLLVALAYPAVASDDEHMDDDDHGMMHSDEHSYRGQANVYIEVKVYSNWSKVEVKIDGTESKFILNTVNIDEIIDEIVNRTGLNRTVVENNIKIEIEESTAKPSKYFKIRHEIEEKKIKYKELMEKKKEMKEKYLKLYNEKKQEYVKLKHRGLGDPVVFNATKEYVVFGIDFIISHLDSLELRILSMNLNNTTADQISADISSIRFELEAWKDRINNSTTPQELRDNVRGFASEWKVLRTKISAVTGKVLALKLLDIIEQAENGTIKIDKKLSDLENRSIDTSGIREAYDRYLNRLASAKEHVMNSIDHFDNAINSTDLGSARNEFALGKTEYYKAISDMKKSLNDLKQVFKEFRKAIREAGSGGGQ